MDFFFGGKLACMVFPWWIKQSISIYYKKTGIIEKYPFTEP